MRVDIITIFPDMFRDVFRFGVINRAQEASILDVCIHDLRNWTRDRHRSTDDSPYGGGPGMVMKVEPLVEAVESVVRKDLTLDQREVVLLSPRGRLLRQDLLRSYAGREQLVLVAGRYEGVDERFLLATGATEVSIGDYVLSGGEIPAMALVEGVTRLLPGAISDPESAREDSFSRGLLDFPHYTRPVEFRNLKVPEILLSGNHGAIRRWRKKCAIQDTEARRPDLLARAELDEEERSVMEELEAARMS
jgi:tRNA (guanine37-N1)-methyltransferase